MPCIRLNTPLTSAGCTCECPDWKCTCCPYGCRVPSSLHGDSSSGGGLLLNEGDGWFFDRINHKQQGSECLHGLSMRLRCSDEDVWEMTITILTPQGAIVATEQPISFTCEPSFEASFLFTNLLWPDNVTLMEDFAVTVRVPETLRCTNCCLCNPVALLGPWFWGDGTCTCGFDWLGGEAELPFDFIVGVPCLGGNNPNNPEQTIIVSTVEDPCLCEDGSGEDPLGGRVGFTITREFDGRDCYLVGYVHNEWRCNAVSSDTLCATMAKYRGKLTPEICEHGEITLDLLSGFGAGHCTPPDTVRIRLEPF